MGEVTVKTSGAPALAQGSDFKVVYTAKDAGDSVGGTESKTDVGEYDIWVVLESENAKKNYEFKGTKATAKVGTMTIARAELILNVSGSEITYGDTLSESTLEGTATIKDSETTIEGTWAWEKEGEYPTVADSGKTEYTVKFTPDADYAGNFVETTLSTTVKITVNKYQLTPKVVASSVESRDYDGKTDVTGGTLTFVEDLSKAPFKDNAPTATGTFTFTNKNVGENKHVKVTGITLDNSTDYTLNATEISDAVTTAEITAKPVELTWEGYTGLVYSGKPVSVTATTSDFVDGDKDTVNIVFADHDKTDAGTYTAKASLAGVDAGNYSITNATQGYTIAKSTVTFTVFGNDVTYDGTAKKVTLANSNTSGAPGLVETSGYTVRYGDDKTESKTDVGNYDIHITLTTDAAKNYKFAGQGDDVTELTVADKKLSITQASSTVTDVSIAADNGELTYGDRFTVSAKVNAPGNVTGKVTFTAGSVELGEAASHADGVWTITVGADEREKQHAIFDNKTITAEYSGDGNINGSSGSNEAVTVAQKPLVYTVTAEGRVWDGETGVTVALEATNTVTGDAITLSAKGDLDNSGNAGTYGTVNLSEVEFDGADKGYYTTDSARENVALTADIEIKKAESSVTAPVGKDGLSYTGEPLALIDAATKYDGGTVKYYVGKDAPADGADGWKTAVSDITGTDVGEYTVWYYVDGDGNHNDTAFASLTVKIDPAKVSFSIGKEDKVDWATRGEKNEDPNPTGYALEGSGTEYALSMTYDSYNHKAAVTQTAGEAVKIEAGTTNGYTVTYRKDGAAEELTEIRDAGTYEIWVTLTPTDDNIYNYTFVGQDEDVYSLKIGEITIETYTVHVTWSHLKYVYHAHKMHPNVRVQNAFKADVQPDVVPDGFDPAVGYSGELLAFAETSDSKVGDYNVEVMLYGASAGNYVVDDNTETVTIVPAPVTFTVGDNIWVIGEGGALSRNTVTLRPAWGAVSTTPDVAVHHSYPSAGTALDLATLDVTIEYWQNGEKVVSPSEAGKYEVWVKIGNINYRHSATETGELHHVGELVITDDPDSITTYTVTFDPGYEGAPEGPATIEKAFPNQTVVLPPVSGENEDGTKYDLTRTGYSFLGWSYNGHTYQPNEELHMPAADVTFKGEWIEAVQVSGRVVQESSGGEPTPVSGATVVLKQGSEPTAEAVTESDGSFDFGLVTPGIYNLEVTYENGSGAKIVKTFLVEVGDSGSVDNEFVLPDTALNTVVEVAPGIKSAVSMDGMIIDETAADVYTEGDKKTVAEGGTVEFKMSISETTLTDDQGKEIPVPEERISMVLDMELTKTVTKEGESSGAPVQIHDSKIPVTTVIHLPAEIQGKSGYTIYRFHDTDGDGIDEMQTITTSPNENGEYLEVIREGTAIELHAQFYSTYVLTWNQITNSSYRITLPAATANGKLTADRTMASRGRTVTLTATPDEGCHLRSLTVTDKNGKPVELTAGGDGTYTFVQPASRVTVEAEFVKCLSMDYTDIDLDAWCHEYTDRVIESGLMLGVGDGVFAPNGTVTRAQMVTALWHMSGDAETDYDMDYTDVSEGDWYCEAIAWATEAGVVNGCGNGKFGPNDPITREQMATMLYRYEQNLGDGGFTGEWMYRLPFTDIEDISDWAFEAVAWCNMEEIVLGRENDTFDPQGEAKRSEMAAVLTRFSEGAEE